MNSQPYDWQRHRYRRDEEVPLLDEGFLHRIDPELSTMYGRVGKTFTTMELPEIPCLILLGEPGIGKSYAIKDLERLLSSDHTIRLKNVVSLRLPIASSLERYRHSQKGVKFIYQIAEGGMAFC